MLWVSNSLHSWCQQQRFVFYECGTLFKDRGLLGRDRIYLPRQGRSISVSWWANLMRRSLNKEQWRRERMIHSQVRKW